MENVTSDHGIGAGKYKKGSLIRYSSLAMPLPFTFVNHNPDNTNNQQIHRKYICPESEISYIPVYPSSGIHYIYRYDKYGKEITPALQYNQATYGTSIHGMIEYNGILTLFSQGAAVRYNLTTGVVITSNNGGPGYYIGTQKGRIVRRGKYAYYSPVDNGKVYKMDLDTFTTVEATAAIPLFMCLSDMDDSSNMYGITTTKKLYKYSENGTLIWQIATQNTCSTNRSVLYSSKRNSVFVATIDTTNTYTYVEEYDAITGGLKNIISGTSLGNPGLMRSVTVSGPFKHDGNFIVFSGGAAFHIKESDLSLIRWENVLFGTDGTEDVSERFILNAFYTTSYRMLVRGPLIEIIS
jgi:hypothetical protein